MMGDPWAQTPVSQKQNAVPTNIITYKGRQLPTRIDPDARVAYIVEIMATSFAAKEHHITLCLRDNTDRLVTQSNLASKVRDHTELKLLPSPTTEALAVVTAIMTASRRSSLSGSQKALAEQSGGMPLKLALFNLQRYIGEDEFADEFVLRGGVKTIVRLVEKNEKGLAGNTLAYALQGVCGILDLQSGLGEVSDTLIDRLLLLLVTATQPNISRPATAIIRKLVIPSPHAAEENATQRTARDKANGKGKKRASDPEGSHRYGFNRIYGRMELLGSDELSGVKGAARAMAVVVKRLEGTGDLELVAETLGLVNACLRSAVGENCKQYPELVTILEKLGIRRYVSRLMPTCSNNVVESQILSFQARYITILQHRQERAVRPAQNCEQERMLADIWSAGRLSSDQREESERLSDTHGNERSWEGWKKMGLHVDGEEGQGDAPSLGEIDLFRDVGELGLECLHWFALHEGSFSNDIMEQRARPQDRQCPIGIASNECVRILCEHYKMSQPGHRSPSSFQLFLLNFPRLHSLVLTFFMRMWHESTSRLGDFERVSLLVRSQIRIALQDEASKTWLNLEHDFLETDYRTIRERQMELIEKEDGMLARPAIRELREKLGTKAYEVMSEQRIGCMLQGSWFNPAILIGIGITSSAKPNQAKPLRFLRLSPNRRTIAWDEFALRTPSPPPYDSLRERIDIANISAVHMQTGCAIGSRSPNLVSKLSFSIMAGSELSMLDVDAIHAAQLAEWTDGIRVLRDAGMATQESASYVHILTELALKVRLLDITGDGVDIPEKVSFGTAPRSVDFWFAK